MCINTKGGRNVERLLGRSNRSWILIFLIGGQSKNCQLLILLRMDIRKILTLSYYHHFIVGRTSKILKGYVLRINGESIELNIFGCIQTQCFDFIFLLSLRVIVDWYRSLNLSLETKDCLSCL